MNYECVKSISFEMLFLCNEILVKLWAQEYILRLKIVKINKIVPKNCCNLFTIDILCDNISINYYITIEIHILCSIVLCFEPE